MIHGILLIDKPSGITSHRVVEKIRYMLNQKSVGHCGTLDPMATGLLVILLGRANKFSRYLLNEKKSYCCQITLGLVTDTLDITGSVLEKKPINVSKQNIQQVIEKSLGHLDLPVPKYSAVKVKGKKLYEYARKNISIELPVKKMFFYNLQLDQIQSDKISLSISCSKGSYIRSWVHFIGKELQTGAVLSQLRRTASNPYVLRGSITLDQLEQRMCKQEKSIFFNQNLSFFIPFSSCLSHFPSIALNSLNQNYFLHGRTQSILDQLQDFIYQTNQSNQPQYVRIMSALSNQLLGVIQVQNQGVVQIMNVFHPECFSHKTNKSNSYK